MMCLFHVVFGKSNLFWSVEGFEDSLVPISNLFMMIGNILVTFLEVAFSLVVLLGFPELLLYPSIQLKMVFIFNFFLCVF